MTDPGRTLSELVATEAPLSPGRALAVMVAVTRELAKGDPELTGEPISSSDVELHPDGSVAVRRELRPRRPDEPSEDGATIGRMLFELLVGRAPLDRTDAFEPALRAALPASTCALVARSCSSAPGQWPSVQDWLSELTRAAAGQAPPLPAPERRSARRRALLLVAALAVLIVLSFTVVVLAPSWWDAATSDDEGSLATGVQLERASS